MTILDKYSKIQSLLDEQKKRRENILEIFQTIFVGELKFEKIPTLEILFPNEKTSNLIKVKIKDKSSVRFIVLKNEKRIQDEFTKKLPGFILKVF